MDKKKDLDPTDLLSGTLNIFGLKIDLGELLASPEGAKGRLEELRERLKEAGGKEVLSDEEWRSGRASISGHIRTRGIVGDREFHIGTVTGPSRRETEPGPIEAPEVVEPPVDVFDEPGEVTIIADVPGISLDDLELKVEGRLFSLATSTTAPRRYQKELRLDADLEPGSLRSTCRNGVLEVRVRKRKRGKRHDRRPQGG